MSETGLTEAADRIERWFAHAWPLWIARGIDPHNRLFVETLDPAGRPDLATPRRVRVQGRQLHCFSRATAFGHPLRPALDRTLDAIAAAAWSEAGGGWIHLLSGDGQPLDAKRDSYDQAFLLFGLAGAAAAGLDRARPLAENTLAFVDTVLTDPRDGSISEGVPRSLPRRSNPHMHLLEALLAWYDLSGARHFLHRADQIAALFAERFLDRDTGTLGEHFTETWDPAPHPHGASVEPGHHLEWSWLLHRLAEAGGRDLRPEARRLHRWALAHGLDRDGFAIDECDRSGASRRTTRRLWPQTELIKSHIANNEPDDAARVACRVLDTYLATDPVGLWIDQFDGSGRACAANVPASTLYHLVVAFEELLRVAGRVPPAGQSIIQSNRIGRSDEDAR